MKESTIKIPIEIETLITTRYRATAPSISATAFGSGSTEAEAKADLIKNLARHPEEGRTWIARDEHGNTWVAVVFSSGPEYYAPNIGRHMMQDKSLKETVEAMRDHMAQYYEREKP